LCPTVNAFGATVPQQSGRGGNQSEATRHSYLLPESVRDAPTKWRPVHGDQARFGRGVLPMNRPLTPSLSPKGERVAGGRVRGGFRAPIHVQILEVLPTHEPCGRGQASWLPVLRASLPAEHLGGRDAARTGGLEALPYLGASRFMASTHVQFLEVFPFHEGGWQNDARRHAHASLDETSVRHGS